MKRLALAAACLLALVAGEGLARAEGIGSDGDRALVAGLPRYNVAIKAGETNANAFGAIAAFERHILPTLNRKDPVGGVFAFELNLIRDVTRGIGTCGISTPDLCPTGYQLHHVNVSAGNLSLMFPFTPHFGGFYTSAFTAVYSSPSGIDVRDVMLPFLPVLGYAFGPVRFFGKNAYESVAGAVMPGTGADAVIGLYSRSEYIAGFAGYAATQGAFADISSPKLDTFISSLLSERFAELAYLKGGLREFDYFGSEKLAKIIGKTNLFGRRLVYNVPTTAPLNKDFAIPVTSAHVEQLDIFEHFDVRVAYRIEPVPEIQEARLGAKYRFAEESDASTYVGATAGMTTLPAFWMYGVGGGKKAAATLEMGVESKELKARAQLRYNDPEVLIVFPYAQDGVSIFLSVNFAPKP